LINNYRLFLTEEEEKMRNSLWTKGLVVGIIALFVGVGVVPSISGDIGNSTNTTDTATVTNTQPEIVIQTIQGGVGITVNLKNIGTADATGVVCTLTLDGTLVFPKTKSQTVNVPMGGTPVPVKFLVFGIGKTNIDVTADTATATATGIAFLFLVLWVK
jgi:translation initiation factor 6 (eIF-6)